MEKRNCRKFHKELRDAMSKAEVEERSSAICKKLLSEPWYRECDLIYGYYPLKNEVNCLTFLKSALSDKKRVALPRTGSDHAMEFYLIRSLEDVEEGHFHVYEPKDTCPLIQEIQAVVLVPGVVFDHSGNRYGYGKGYYDRYFERFPQLMRFALAYENQMEEKLEVLQTDIKMHRIYTETGCYCAKQ